MIRYKIIHSIISSAQQGFRDLAVVNEDFNSSMSQMQASLIQVRNSIATAFAPALQTLAPIVVKVADAISWLFTQIAMWGSAFAGNSYYYRAKKVTTDYAVSLGNANKEQQKANAEQKKMLAGFDELNVLMEKSTNGLNSGTGLPSAQEMFEKVEIPQDVIEKANYLKEKIQELLPLLEAIGVIIAGYKLGQLFGLWDKGTGLVNRLTNAFKDKNSALGDQQGEYAKEYSWLKDLIPQFLTSAISVWALSSALGDLKNNPIEMPSLQPVVDYEASFETAKNNINTSMEGMQEAVTKNVNESMDVLNEAIPVIDTNVATAGDTIINGASRVTTEIEANNHAISKSIHDTIVANKNELEIGTAEQVAIAQSGYTDMEQDAENLSENIQTTFIKFLTATAQNIQKWVTNVIMPAISLMEAMNEAGDEKIFSLGGVNKAVSKVKESVKNISTTLIQPIKNKISSEIRSAQMITNVIGQNVGNWLGIIQDIGVKQGVENLKAGATLVGPVVAGAYALTTGDTSMLEKLVPAFASGGVVGSPTLALVGEGSTPEIIAPQDMLLATNQRANIPVMNAIEEMGDKLVTALNSIGVYAEFDYSKLKVGLDNENYRVGGKLYGI